MPSRSLAHARPYRTLLTIFAAWKFFLFAIVLGSSLVGGTYDTSAALVIQGGRHDSSAGLITRLASWDAIYFVSIARRGCRFEQDWAFCGALPVVIRGVKKG